MTSRLQTLRHSSATSHPTPPPQQPHPTIPILPSAPNVAPHNPFKSKKPWPPDFTQLSPLYQFHLERKYRRRTKLKYARPTWTKVTKLVQWGGVGFVLVYGVLFMDWGDWGKEGESKGKGEREEPFREVRAWFRGVVEGFWTQPSVEEVRRRKDE
jgi:hypothetical protein